MPVGTVRPSKSPAPCQGSALCVPQALAEISRCCILRLEGGRVDRSFHCCPRLDRSLSMPQPAAVALAQPVAAALPDCQFKLLSHSPCTVSCSSTARALSFAATLPAYIQFLQHCQRAISRCHMASTHPVAATWPAHCQSRQPAHSQLKQHRPSTVN